MYHAIRLWIYAHTLAGAFLDSWIFPRPKEQSTGLFLALALLGSGFQIHPSSSKRKNPSKWMGFLFGGAGGIWTLGTLLGYTRFPVVPVMTTSILLRICRCFNQLAYNNPWCVICQVFSIIFFDIFLLGCSSHVWWGTHHVGQDNCQRWLSWASVE